VEGGLDLLVVGVESWRLFPIAVENVDQDVIGVVQYVASCQERRHQGYGTCQGLHDALRFCLDFEYTAGGQLGWQCKFWDQ